MKCGQPFWMLFDIVRDVCYDGPGRSFGAALSKCNTYTPTGKEKTMEDKGFFGALFDMSFSEFVTLKFIRILYIILLVIIAIGLVIAIITGFISMFTDSFLAGLMAIIVAPIGAIISVVLTRIWLEVLVVVFRIAENTTDLVQMKKGE
jgi:hypothetical protein